MRIAPTDVRRSRTRFAVALCLCLAGLGARPDAAMAITTATGPNGSRITIVKQATTYNLSGAGVTLGQVEGGRPGDPQVIRLPGPPPVPETFHPHINPGGAAVGVAEVNAAATAAVSPPPAIFAGTTHGGNRDNHATQVAGVMIGSNAGNLGVANGATLFSAAARQIGGGGGLMTHHIVGFEWVRAPAQGATIINYSAGFNGPSPTPGTALISMYADWVQSQQGVLIVQAGPEQFPPAAVLDGPPDDAFNSLVVGMTMQNPTTGRYDRIQSAAGAIGLTNIETGPGGGNRNNIHVVAPGNIANLARWPAGGYGPSIGTSYSAPLTAGVAALLQQRANAVAALPSGRLFLKASIMNSASKHVLDRTGPPGTAWPVAYRNRNPDLNNAAVATPERVQVPLDPWTGTGQVNALAAVQQYQAATEPHNGLRGGTVGPTMPTVQQDNYGLGMLHRGALVAATLNWDRQVTHVNGAAPTIAQLQAVGNYTAQPYQNLDLLLRNTDTGTAVIRSFAANENHEHIYFNVPATGNYRLEVNNATNTANTPYALAWKSGSTDGAAFSVDRAAEGWAQNPIGVQRPNDVYSLGMAGPANFQTEGEIFVSGYDFANMQRLSGALATQSRVGPHLAPPASMAMFGASAFGGGTRGTLGIVPGDNVIGLSWGADGTGSSPGVPLFSVDPATIGGAHVNIEAVTKAVGGAVTTPRPMNPIGGDPGGEAAGDIFRTPRFAPFGAYNSRITGGAPIGSNRKFVDEQELGLQAPAGRGSLLGGNEDDVDAFEEDSPLATVDQNGDGLHDRSVFFLLDPASPSLAMPRPAGVPAGASPDDIFVSRTPGTFSVYATGEQVLNLMPHPAGIELDALVLSDVSTPTGLSPLGMLLDRLTSAFVEDRPDGRRDDRGRDEALISFSRGHAPAGADSTSIYYIDFQREFNPDTHFLDFEITLIPPDIKPGSYYALAGEFGMRATDDLNALDIRKAFNPVPKRFQLIPDQPVIIDPQTDLLDFIVETAPGNPAEVLTVGVVDAVGFGQGGPQPVQIEVHGFDSGGVDQVYTVDNQDNPGTKAFYETFLSNGQPQLPQQSQYVFHVDLTELEGPPLLLKMFPDDQIFLTDVTPDGKSASTEFMVNLPIPEIPGDHECQFWHFLTEIEPDQDLTIGFIDYIPFMTTGSGGEDIFLSSFDIVLELHAGPGFDPFLPLFSTTIEAFVPEPGTAAILLLGLAGLRRRRR